jgi:hypothetical protein
MPVSMRFLGRCDDLRKCHQDGLNCRLILGIAIECSFEPQACKMIYPDSASFSYLLSASHFKQSRTSGAEMSAKLMLGLISNSHGAEL